MARKSGNLQTAYSAVLQACQTRTLVAQVEAAKLTKATGEKFRALQELETLLGQHGILGNEVIDVSASDEEKQLALKVQPGMLA
jgi:serine/threonine-protein kinase ATR